MKKIKNRYKLKKKMQKYDDARERTKKINANNEGVSCILIWD